MEVGFIELVVKLIQNSQSVSNLTYFPHNLLSTLFLNLPVVNFINVKRRNFSYKHCVSAAFSSYMYTEKQRSYENVDEIDTCITNDDWKIVSTKIPWTCSSGWISHSFRLPYFSTWAERNLKIATRNKAFLLLQQFWKKAKIQ